MADLLSGRSEALPQGIEVLQGCILFTDRGLRKHCPQGLGQCPAHA